MANKRIIELDVTDVVENDDFLAIDSVSGTTRRIKPIKIGATYEIEDGDHSFTLVGSNGYSHTVNIPYDSVSMTQAEYDALTPAQKADGTARFITDGQSDVESELWSKVGRQTLDTDAQVLSNAVNELKGDIDTNTDDINTNTDAISELNSSLSQRAFVGSQKSISVTVPANGTVNVNDTNYVISGKTYIGTLIYSFAGASVSVTAGYAGQSIGVGFVVHNFNSSTSLTISIVYRHLYI